MCNHIKLDANRIDPCIKIDLAILNANGLKTLASCCGHLKYSQTIIVQDSKGAIFEYNTKISITRKKRFYAKDCEGYFYIPEVEMQRYKNFNWRHSNCV